MVGRGARVEAVYTETCRNPLADSSGQLVHRILALCLLALELYTHLKSLGRGQVFQTKQGFGTVCHCVVPFE